MTASKKNARGKSARKQAERPPIEIAVVFTGPNEPQKAGSAATPADPTAKKSESKKKDPLIFRF